MLSTRRHSATNLSKTRLIEFPRWSLGISNGFHGAQHLRPCERPSLQSSKTIPNIHRLLSNLQQHRFFAFHAAGVAELLAPQRKILSFFDRHTSEDVLDRIRNFCVIAHIDHGKSTICDRLLQYGGVLTENFSTKQYLDTLEVERERGITIKAQTCSFLANADLRGEDFEYDECRSEMDRMFQNAEYHENKNKYSVLRDAEFLLNLIDTPGHVDFGYEVSRSLSCCQGAILLVDVMQGVQAQTVSTFYQAFCQDLVVIPVLNKIDMLWTNSAVKGGSRDSSQYINSGKNVTDSRYRETYRRQREYIDEVKREMITTLDDSWTLDDILEVSAKSGEGIDTLIDAIVNRIPSPKKSIFAGINNGGLVVRSSDQPANTAASVRGLDHLRCKALIFDMFFNLQKGVVLCVYLQAGEMRRRQKVRCHFSKMGLQIHDVGMLTPAMAPTSGLKPGQIGYITVNNKNIHAFRVGDTIFDKEDDLEAAPCPGFQTRKAMVWAGIFASSPQDSDKLEQAMNRFLMSDSSVEAHKQQHSLLGNGYRCGFLGLLHLDVFKQRIWAEWKTDILIASPTIPYRLTLDKGGGETRITIVESARDYPMDTRVISCEEPTVKAVIVIPDSMVSQVQRFCNERRGILTNLQVMGERDENEKQKNGGKNDDASEKPGEPDASAIIGGADANQATKDDIRNSEAAENTRLRTLMEYEIPFSEVMQDFFDRLQSLSSGYASFDYEFYAYREVTLQRVDIKINEKPVHLLSFLCLESKARSTAEKFLKKLTEMIPPDHYEIKLQALTGGTVICRDRIRKLGGLSNDIIAKKILSHGHSGDPQRKKKLLDQAKAQQKKMRKVADVNLPAEAFLEMMKL